MINDPVNSGFQPKPPVSESKPAASAAPRLASGSPTSAPLQPASSSTEAAATETADKKQLQATVRKLNDYVQNMRRTLSFSVEESTGRTVISVYDAETDELIRQIPPEETMNLAELLEGQLKSVMVREKA